MRAASARPLLGSPSVSWAVGLHAPTAGDRAEAARVGALRAAELLASALRNLSDADAVGCLASSVDQMRAAATLASERISAFELALPDLLAPESGDFVEEVADGVAEDDNLVLKASDRDARVVVVDGDRREIAGRVPDDGGQVVPEAARVVVHGRDGSAGGVR